ncbi:MAG: radical SAM protein [Bacteroidales bacterium]|nr:radical SAM protein [Bacteroidales bacterium]
MSCNYCCNKLDIIQNSFKMVTFDKFIDLSTRYTDINISGGEPLLSEIKLYRMLKLLSSKINKWLYTNGTLLPNTKLDVNGVNIGIHENFDKIQNNIQNRKNRYGF